MAQPQYPPQFQPTAPAPTIESSPAVQAPTQHPQPLPPPPPVILNMSQPQQAYTRSSAEAWYQKGCMCCCCYCPIWAGLLIVLTLVLMSIIGHFAGWYKPDAWTPKSATTDTYEVLYP